MMKHVLISSFTFEMTRLVVCLRAGCFIAPLTFQMYWKSFPIGVPSSEYIAPYANIYRGMAIIGTQVKPAPRSVGKSSSLLQVSCYHIQTQCAGQLSEVCCKGGRYYLHCY